MVTAKQRKDLLDAISNIDREDRLILLEDIQDILCLECGRITEGDMESAEDCLECQE